MDEECTEKGDQNSTFRAQRTQYNAGLACDAGLYWTSDVHNRGNHNLLTPLLCFIKYQALSEIVFLIAVSSF